MKNETEIRRLTETQIRPFQKILYSVLDEIHPDHPDAVRAYQQQFTVEKIQSDLSSHRGSYLIATLNTVPCGIGIGYNRGGVAFLNWICVEPEFRDQGTGTRLLSALHQDFKNWGCWKSELFTYQAVPELTTFYGQAGYKTVAQLPNHYYGLDITYMVCSVL